MKKKLDKEDDKSEINKGKKVHRSLKNYPKPITTPALKKKRENELRENPKQNLFKVKFIFL